MPRLLIAASGTGGHIYPALSLASALSNSWEVKWLGVPNRMEIELVSKRYHLTKLNVGGLQGNIFRKILEFFKLIFASFQVYNLLHEKNIDVVFTTGGYISAPTIIGAKLTGIPILLHESNAIPGKATRLLGGFCDHIALGIPSASKYLSGFNTSFTGTPVRPEFLIHQPLPSWVPFGEGELIVIMGGSQGAKKLNEMVRSFLPGLLEKNCRIVHITGNKDQFYWDLEKTLKHPNLITRAFSNEIPALLQHADLAISRSGSGAICELMITRTPAVLIPFPHSTDQHQDLNAAYMATFGGAIIVKQHHAEENILRDILFDLVGSLKLREMKTNMNNHNIINSEKMLVSILKNLI